MAGTTMTSRGPGGSDSARDLMWETFVHGDGTAVAGCMADGRVPVLAPATTALPMRLDAIFPRQLGPVPVTRMVLRGRAAVFEAHVGASGGLAARLVDCPPAATSVLVLWTTEDQLGHLARFEEAEGRELVEIDAGRVELDGVALPRALVPMGRNGPLRHGSLPVRVAEVPTIGCIFPALTMRAALHFIHRRLAVDEPYDAFERALAKDPDYRAAINARLAAGA